jgi:hypothetical protein
MKEVTKKWMISILGVIVASFSIVMSIKANFGLNAYNGLLGNISEATGLTMGIFSWTTGFLFILFNMIVSKKKKFNWSALLVSFMFGSFIDFFYVLLAGDVAYESLMIRLIVFLSMIVMAGIGISLLIFSGIISPVEEYQFAIKKIFKTSIATAKVYSDLSFLVAAVAVSLFSHNGLGLINVGTIVVTLTTGRVIGMILELLNRNKSTALVEA